MWIELTDNCQVAKLADYNATQDAHADIFVVRYGTTWTPNMARWIAIFFSWPIR